MQILLLQEEHEFGQRFRSPLCIASASASTLKKQVLSVGLCEMCLGLGNQGPWSSLCRDAGPFLVHTQALGCSRISGTLSMKVRFRVPLWPVRSDLGRQ